MEQVPQGLEEARASAAPGAGAERPSWRRVPLGLSQSPLQVLEIAPASRYMDDDPAGFVGVERAAGAGASQGVIQRPDPASRFLVASRANVACVLLVAASRIRLVMPGVTPELAWDALVAKFVRDGVFENRQEVSTAWLFAFRQPPQAHFRSIIEGDAQTLQEARRDAE